MTTSAPARLVLVARLCVSVGFLVGVAASGGCGHPPSQGYGNVDLQAMIPADVVVTVLAFRIGGPQGPLASGALHARPAGRQLEQLVTHVPAGDDEHVDITGKSADGQLTCSGSAPLEVRKGVTTRVSVAVQCRGVNDGVVGIKVTIACTPAQSLVSYMVSPLSASLGGTVDVEATQVDADAGTLRYAWTASTGTFADPSSPATTYRCETPGPVSMTLVVNSDQCQATYMIDKVTCSAPDGGGD